MTNRTQTSSSKSSREKSRVLKPHRTRYLTGRCRPGGRWKDGAQTSWRVPARGVFSTEKGRAPIPIPEMRCSCPITIRRSSLEKPPILRLRSQDFLYLAHRDLVVFLLFSPPLHSFSLPPLSPSPLPAPVASPAFPPPLRSNCCPRNLSILPPARNQPPQQWVSLRTN